MNNGPFHTSVQKILTTVPPAFSKTRAVAVAADRYGISGSVEPLVSERVQNFKLTTQAGLGYTLKISNFEEKEDVIDFQNQALLHVAKQDPSLPLPRIIPTIDGQLHCRVEQDGKLHIVRMLSWLEGSIIHDASIDSGLARRLGQLLARLDSALQGYDHPGSNSPLLWDIKQYANLAELVVNIEETGLIQMIYKKLDNFVTEVKPVLETLRVQVIHNDMNPGNILMDNDRPGQIAGLIDFGDMTRSPLVIDLAVAAAYQLYEGSDPLAGALPMIAGYHDKEPLQDNEMSLLTDLIRTRLVTSLLIGTYRSTLFPENREYLLISQRPVRNSLINLSHLRTDEALSRIRSACLAS